MEKINFPVIILVIVPLSHYIVLLFIIKYDDNKAYLMVVECGRKCCNNSVFFPKKIFENFYQPIWHTLLPSRFLSLNFEGLKFHNKNTVYSVVLIVFSAFVKTEILINFIIKCF